jgi:hypothetical protein
MGSFPSADLLYGIDLGMDEDREQPEWFTEELEEEYGGEDEVLDHLLKGIKGVGYCRYGNRVNGYTGLALCTQLVGAGAYKAKPIGIDQLSATVGDDNTLRAAWAILYPDQLMPDPGWFLTVSYG